MLSDFVGLSPSTVGIVVNQVSCAIASKRDNFIFMPRNREELMKTFGKFFEIGTFPTVAGTIDCTHVKVSGQGGSDGELFRNRKQFFSINVQSVSNADLSFQDIVARWPGSTHDSHIFRQSRLKSRFEDGEFQQGLLLGDGGYKLETYLMTPIRNPRNDKECNYNRVQILVRNTVERKYGVWKRRFPCLVFGLRCKLETALAVIVACAVVHNLCIQQKDEAPPVDVETERAVEETTMEAERTTETLEARTTNSNRQAIFKRQILVEQISEMN